MMQNIKPGTAASSKYASSFDILFNPIPTLALPLKGREDKATDP